MKLVRNPSFNGKPDAGNPHVRFDEGENVGGHWQCLSSRGVLSTLLARFFFLRLRGFARDRTLPRGALLSRLRRGLECHDAGVVDWAIWVYEYGLGASFGRGRGITRSRKPPSERHETRGRIEPSCSRCRGRCRRTCPWRGCRGTSAGGRNRRSGRTSPP